MLPVGSLVNALAIIAGGTVGLLLHGRFPERFRVVVFQGLGLCVTVLGLQMALKAQNILVVIFSLLIGGLLGEALRLEDRLEGVGDRVKALMKSKNPRFTEGLVTASLIFCIGAMAIVGSFDEGLRGDPSVLITKSVLDGFASLALASSFGAGVIFSFVPVFVYQGSLTLFAGAFQSVFSEALIAQLTAVGGVLILGIGITLLDIKRIKLSNLLPALVVAVVLSFFFG
jgi:uncharacterized membrane protein YqgA involved in biofilm formation